MTREEAIEVLGKMKYPQKVNKNGFIISNVNIENEALEMAIKALSQEPIKYWIDYNGHVTPIQQPSVTQKSGKWIKMFLTDTGDIDGQCSECGFIHKFIDGHTAQYNYCPNCGAKMESEDKECR